MIVKELCVAVTSKEIQFLARRDISNLDHENARAAGKIVFSVAKSTPFYIMTPAIAPSHHESSIVSTLRKPNRNTGNPF